MITSVIFFFGMRDGTKERKTHRVKSTDLLAHLDNLFQSVELIDEAPVVHIAIFHHTWNHVCRIFIHVQLFAVNIPKYPFRQLAYTFLTVHAKVIW